MRRHPRGRIASHRLFQQHIAAFGVAAIDFDVGAVERRPRRARALRSLAAQRIEQTRSLGMTASAAETRGCSIARFGLIAPTLGLLLGGEPVSRRLFVTA